MSSNPPPLTRFKVMSFDVVGTLIDFERGMLDFVRKRVPQAAAVSDGAFLDSYRRARGSDAAGLFPDDLVRVWHDVARDLELPQDPDLAKAFRDSVPSWPAFPDSGDALRRLRSRCKLVAMTNAQRWAHTHFENTLGHPFADTVTVDDAGVEKPDPQFFAFARGRLSVAGFALADILHVAQSQYHDIGVARELGYTVCWIERRKGQSGYGGTLAPSRVTAPDYHYASLVELADAVDAAAKTNATA
jgi:putative hydrolase of the HAD superfamily